MEQELTGKVVIVTGAGRMRSIGRRIAKRLAQAGAAIVITGTGRPPERYPVQRSGCGAAILCRLTRIYAIQDRQVPVPGGKIQTNLTGNQLTDVSQLASVRKPASFIFLGLSLYTLHLSALRPPII